MIARVEATDSCCPATWKTSVPKASSGGSSSIQARGRKPGRASIRRASTGSAFRRNSRALRSASAARLRGRLSTLIPGLSLSSTLSGQERVQQEVLEQQLVDPRFGGGFGGGHAAATGSLRL